MVAQLLYTETVGGSNPSSPTSLFSASDSVSSGVSSAFTGEQTDKTLWLLLGGSAAAIVGGVMTFRDSKT